MSDKLTDPKQYAALLDFAQRHGRTWKSSLRQCWMTGQYGPSDASNHLQQIRNSFGPSWLVKFRLPAIAQVTETPNPAPKTSDYTQAHLSKRSIETFLAISGGYPKGHCRMNGTCSWFLRVSNHGASLVTTYQTKDESGQWSGTNEHSEAL